MRRDLADKRALDLGVGVVVMLLSIPLEPLMFSGLIVIRGRKTRTSAQVSFIEGVSADLGPPGPTNFLPD